MAEEFLSSTVVAASIESGQALLAWAKDGIGKKLTEKFGFSENDLAVGPIETSAVQARKGAAVNKFPFVLKTIAMKCFIAYARFGVHFSGTRSYLRG